MTTPDGAEHTGVPAELFDCVQVNVAVLARRRHGPGAELALGARLRFRPRPGPGGLPTVEPDPAAELARCAAAGGLSVLSCEHRDPARVAPECLVVADAFALPWLPYAGRRHLDHGFLVDHAGPDELGGVDAYHTDTPWGPARPGRWRMSRDAFAALPGPVLVTTLDTGAYADPGPSADLAGPDGIDAYVDAYAGHPDRGAAWERLTLETWLLGRSRLLHAAYRDARGATVPHEHPDAWRSLVEQVFVGARRVQRGRAEPSGAFDRLRALLRADREAFRTPVDDDLRDAVAEVVADVLGVRVPDLPPDRPLTDVAAVDSFRLVQIMERVEDALGVEFDPDLLVPENFADVDTITRVLVRPARAVPR